jgi:hypothetical protein
MTNILILFDWVLSLILNVNKKEINCKISANNSQQNGYKFIDS